MHRLTRTVRAAAIAVLGAVLISVIAACGGANTSTGKATVTYMTWENATTNSSIDTAMAKFSDPNITVQRLGSPATDYGQKINSLVLAKQLPDFFWCGNDTEQDFGSKGLLFDWTSYLKANGDFDPSKFAPGSIDNWKAPNGHLYGLPTLMNTYGYFYNADLLKAANVDIPKAGWTYDQFFADVAKLTKKSGNSVTQYGAVGGPYDGPFALSVYSVSAGGQPFEDKIVGPSKVTIDPKFVEGTQKFVDAVKAGYITPGGYNGGDTNAAFLAGKVPMLWGGQWNAASFLQQKPSFTFGFAPFPVVSQNVVIFDAVGICSPSYIKNPDAVWKVMTYLDSQAWKDILPGAPVAPAAYVPASSTYFDTLNKAGVSSVSDAVNSELSAPNLVGVRFMSSWSSKANDIINASWNDILNGKKPVQPTLDTMASQLNDLIKSNP